MYGKEHKCSVVNLPRIWLNSHKKSLYINLCYIHCQMFDTVDNFLPNRKFVKSVSSSKPIRLPSHIGFAEMSHPEFEANSKKEHSPKKHIPKKGIPEEANSKKGTCQKGHTPKRAHSKKSTFRKEQITKTVHSKKGTF